MPDATPNILLIMSDEHDPAVTGCYGDRIVQTPNLDRLAAEGVTFDGCYTTSPLCVPARLSFTAGKYVSRCGGWNNNCRLASDDIVSLPRVLQRAGYDTYLCGKMHYDARHRYGYTDLVPDVKSNSHSMPGTLDRRRFDSTEIASEVWKSRIDQFYTADESQSGIMRHDVRCTEAATQFLAQRRRGDKPFFLTVGYLAPHFPLIVPQRFYDAVKGRVPAPQLPTDWFERLPWNYKHLVRGFGIPAHAPEMVQLGRELYWALTGWLDAELGKVLHALERSAAGRDTIVIYTSDHGENKGDHGLWWKNNMYEHASRIPLIVRDPRRWRGGQRRQGACSLVDLVQTVVELGGGDAPGDWNGSSLVKWLDDPAHSWKDLAVSEYYGHNVATGFAMIRRGAYKYVYHTSQDAHGPERELYNLVDDPGEWQNLSARPEHQARIRALHAELVRELGRDPEDAERECRSMKAYAK